MPDFDISDNLPFDAIDSQGNEGIFRQPEGNPRFGVEGIGVVLGQKWVRPNQRL